MEALDQLLEGLPNSEMITTDQKTAVLNQSLVPDSNGVYPGQPHYVATYDSYYAAYLLVAFLEAQPLVTSASSEGTSVTATSPNWGALRGFYRSMSPVLAATNDALQVIPIPYTPYTRRTDMSGRNDHYGDVNTESG